MSETVIVIPARLASTRFPRKLLHPIQGKSIIQWTAERVAAAAPEFALYFAVAEPELADFLRNLGYSVIMTDPDCPSGTDRIAEANRQIGAAHVLNVQADEPLVTGDQIRMLAQLLQTGPDMATLATPFIAAADFRDPNRVKVVRSLRGDALYFSRSPIPFDRETGGNWPRDLSYLHLGLYGYTAEFLEIFQTWNPTPLEQLEKLEQLRALENGSRIAVGITANHGIGIDTPEDAVRFEQLISG